MTFRSAAFRSIGKFKFRVLLKRINEDYDLFQSCLKTKISDSDDIVEGKLYSKHLFRNIHV
jgi:hypothetical protein